MVAKMIKNFKEKRTNAIEAKKQLFLESIELEPAKPDVKHRGNVGTLDVICSLIPDVNIVTARDIADVLEHLGYIKIFKRDSRTWRFKTNTNENIYNEQTYTKIKNAIIKACEVSGVTFYGERV